MRSKSLEGEHQIYMTTRHPFYLVGKLILLIIPTLMILAFYLFPERRPFEYKYFEYTESFLWVVFLLFFIPLVIDIFKIKSDKFYITNKRVIHEQGVWGMSIRQNPIDKIGNIDVEFGIIGNIFKYGYVSFNTSSDHRRTVYKFVKQPLLFVDKLNEVLEKNNL